MRSSKAFGLVTAFFLILGLQSAGMTGSADGGSLKIDLNPVWTTGIVSDDFGREGIVVEDVDLDGLEEIVACTESVFVLNHDSSGGYQVAWYGEDIDCNGITTGDRDGDGIAEIYALSDDDEIVVYDGVDLSEIGRFTVPGGSANDIVTGDVDGDGQLEIIVAKLKFTGQENKTAIFSADTFDLEWEFIGYGGDTLAIGEIDGDGEIEIIVNYPNVQASVLNAKWKTVEWVFSGGFGMKFSIGDVDNDQIDEIAYIEGWDDAYVFEGDTQTVKWSYHDLSDLAEVLVADVDGDGLGEVLIGNGQWGHVTGYRGADGAVLWAIPNPEHGVFGLAVGDSDDDGTKDVVFGAGLSSGGKDAMIVGDWTTETVKYISPDLDGRLNVTAADIDLDGDVEIVMASYSTDSGYDGSTLQIIDGLSHEIEWTKIAGGGTVEVHTGQLDDDPALEILLANAYGALFVVDGITQALEWQIFDLGSPAPAGVIIENLDGDPVEEILVAYPYDDSRVLVFNGASDEIQWESDDLGIIRDLSIGDTDGDSIRELAILTWSELIVLDLDTWMIELSVPVEDASRVGSLAYGPGISGRFLVYSSSNSDELQILHGATGEKLQTLPLPDLNLNSIIVSDLDSDGDLEIALLGLEEESEKSYLEIFSSPNPFIFLKEYTETGSWGSINSLALGNLDADSDQELVLGSGNLIQVREITVTPLSFSLAFLPGVESCTLLYADDFSNDSSGWPEVDTGDTLYQYLGGEYRTLVRYVFGFAGAYPGPTFTSYLVSTDVRNVNNLDGTYGLLFAHEYGWTDFYTFEIDNNQNYEIWLYNGNWNKLQEGSSPYLKTGSETNRIGIVRNGSAIVAYANGANIASLESAPLSGPLRVGIWVTGGQDPLLDIRFDNYKVEPIGCGWSAGMGNVNPDGPLHGPDLPLEPGWIRMDLPPKEK